jgi:hypothetical protein
MSDSTNRILAVEIRAARIGYAVFEFSGKFLDFGAGWFDSPSTARSRINRLLGLFRPSLLVFRKAERRHSQKSIVSRAVAKAVRNEARRLGIPIAYVSQRVLKTFYQRNSCRNKYEVAALLADWHPEIAWRLPKKRKFYGPEPRVMIYFDSAALGEAYLGTTNAIEEIPPNGNPFAGLQTDDVARK